MENKLKEIEKKCVDGKVWTRITRHVQPCLVRTKTNSLAVRLFKIDDRKISLWQESKGELVLKFNEDFKLVKAIYEPLVLAE